MRSSTPVVAALSLLLAALSASAWAQLVVDGHNHDAILLRRGVVDVTGLRELASRGVGAVVVPLPLERTPTGDLLQRAEREVEALERAASADPGFALADPGAPPGAAGPGSVQVLLAIEWFRPIFGSDPGRARLFRRLGIRMIGLAEEDPDRLFGRGAGASSLTGLGRRVITAMNECGVVIDVTHLSHAQKIAVISHSRAPVVASHSLARGVTPESFNLPDDVIAALAGHGGSVWVSFNRSDLLGGVDEDRTLELLLDHIDYLAVRLGPEHVGIGSDLQAHGRYVPAELNRPDTFARIRQGLAARGYSRTSIDGILGGNVLSALGVRE